MIFENTLISASNRSLKSFTYCNETGQFFPIYFLYATVWQHFVF